MPQGDLAEDAGLGTRLEALPRLDRRLEPVGPEPFIDHPARELVHDFNPAAADDVVHVATEEGGGVQGAVERLQERLVLRRVEAASGERGFGGRGAALRQKDVPPLGVGLVVEAGSQAADEPGHASGFPGRPLLRPGDDERDPRFVDEDGIGLVDEGGMERPMNPVPRRPGDPVAEKIEARFLGRRVRDVGGIGRPFVRAGQALPSATHAEPEAAIHGSHPGRVAAGEVIVEGQDVDAAPGEGEEGGGEDRCQGFPLARRELCDTPVRHGQAGDELDIERLERQGAPGRLADEGEAFDRQTLRRSAAPRPAGKARRAAEDLFVRELLRAVRADRGERRDILFEIGLQITSSGPAERGLKLG